MVVGQIGQHTSGKILNQKNRDANEQEERNAACCDIENDCFPWSGLITK